MGGGLVRRGARRQVSLALFSRGVRKLGRQVTSIVINRRRAISLILATVLTGNRILVRNIPKMTGALLTHLATQLVSTSFDHVRFAPSLVPDSILKAAMFGVGAGRFSFRGKPVFTSVMLISRVGHTPTGARSTLFRMVRRHRVDVSKAARQVKRLCAVLTARGPIRRRKACGLPRTRLSHFLVGVAVSCPSLSRRIGVLRHRRFGTTLIGLSSVAPTLAGRRLLALHTFVGGIFISHALLRCVTLVIRRAHADGTICLKTSPHTSITVVRTSGTCTLLRKHSFIAPRSVGFITPCILRRHLVLATRTRVRNCSPIGIARHLVSGIRIPG